jgi:hypothetical protein
MNRELRPERSDKAWMWMAVAVVVAGAAALIYLRTRPETAASPVLPPASLPAPAPTAEVSHHPIEEAQIPFPASPAAALPAVEQSDDLLSGLLIDIAGQSLFDTLFEHKDIVRRIVATVDNLPREMVPGKVWALKPAAGHFLVSGQDGNYAIAPENSLRYVPYLQLVQAVAAHRLVVAYLQHYSLFQQAYQDLGYPQGYFNDRLIFAIDNLLATPTATSPQPLLQPHVLYQYADPSLEALSFGQKTLLRMGADDEAAIKSKLREIRTLLVKEAPAKP